MSRLTWQAGMAVSLGEFAEPATVQNFGYECTVAGTTGVVEPVWPLVAAGTVVDGTVTWTARTAMTITWTARPLYTTGLVEPSWPTTIGATVVDGNITWTTETPQIQDAKCPHTIPIKIMAEKVFAPYSTVLRYSATSNPRDWSSPDDAGFLNTGEHSPDTPEVTALEEYRGRLAVWNAGGLQIWTVDPDPAEMALFDTHPGIGTIHARAVKSVAGDTYFLTAHGVRSLSVAAGADTLESNDVGANIDEIITVLAEGPDEPFAFNVPGLAQWVIAFGNQAYVLSRSRLGRIGAWSHYVYPYAISDTTQGNGELYYRCGQNLYRVDREGTLDDGLPFEGVIEWPYLDLESPGTHKMLHGVDIVGYGVPAVQIGYDQTSASAWTPLYETSPDTIPDGIIPIPVGGPSFALRITYKANQRWSLNAVSLYLEDGKGYR